MAKGKKRAKLLETKYFGLIIGLIIVILFFWLKEGVHLPLLETLELKMMDIHFNFKNLVLKTSDANAIKQRAVERGMATLRRDGAQKVLDGITTIDEVIRVTQD